MEHPISLLKGLIMGSCSHEIIFQSYSYEMLFDEP